MLLTLLVVCLVLFVVVPFVGATLWAIMTTLLVGLLLGALARVIAPGTNPLGLLTTAVVGVAGSLLGTLAAGVLDTGSLVRLLLQVASAVALVMLLRPSKGVPS